MKIEVPQELINQICDLYQKGYTRVYIKEKLNLSFGDSVIKRILLENNIPLRKNGYKREHKEKIFVDRETQDKIIKLYNQGYGLDKIVVDLNLPFSFDKVRSILKQNNVHIRNVQEAHQVMHTKDLRKYPVNDDYCLESHNGAWLLGLLAADGYLPITKGAKNRITLTLQRRDEEVLHLIAEELNYQGPIYQFESSNGYEESSLSFTSKTIRQQLENYGIVNNKTFKLIHIPNLPEEYILDFIRGYFDGDGSVFYHTAEHKIGMSFTCANEQFLTEIRDKLVNYGLTKVLLHEVERVHIIYDIRYGTGNSLKLGKLFYNNDYLTLPRKKQKFFEVKEMYENYKK